ncbi:hypothetical protein ACFQ0F_06820 [Paraperlucidibaca wandonensis]|uniref:Uncharacterized protein n=1 Tax=Paraperlucidibaca wandonensis TaxID=1268273 RepID=A0ABW3HFU2_9GAMM
MLKLAAANEAEIKYLRKTQEEAAFDAACTATLTCSIARRLGGMTTSSSTTQPDPAKFKYYTYILRNADGMVSGTLLATALIFCLWLLIKRRQLRLTQIAMLIKTEQAIHKDLSAESANLKQQLLTLREAQQLAAEGLQAAMAGLRLRQESIEAQKKTKVRLEKDIAECRKTLVTLKGTYAAQGAPRSTVPPHLMAKTIFST